MADPAAAPGRSGPSLGFVRRGRPAGRAVAAGAPHRPGQPARRLPGQGRGLDRGHAAGRLGEPRPRRRRIRPHGADLGVRSRSARTRAASRPTACRCSWQLRDDGKPALCFSAHLANWELPAVAAAAQDMPSAVVYRMPNNKAVAREITRIRAPLMGRLIRTRAQAAMEMAAALSAGEHLGMLVDQHFSRGVDVTFFGRRCKANPSIARLARRFDCPVVGVRVVRLPDHRFRIDGVRPLRTAARCRGRDRCAGRDADDHRRHRGLGARASRPVSVVSSPLALMPGWRVRSTSEGGI